MSAITRSLGQSLMLDAPPPEGGADWLLALRTDSYRCAHSLGFPGVRTEAWRYTPLSKVSTGRFAQANEGGVRVPLPDEIGTLSGVLVNVLNAVPVAPPSLPDGVELVVLAADAEVAPEWVSETLGTIDNYREHMFTALNGARFQSVLALRIRRGVTVEHPIHLAFQSSGAASPVQVFPRVLVVVEEGASADIVESHVGAAGYLSCPVVEVIVGRDARLGHYKLQAEGDEAFHIAMTAVRCEAASTYDNFALSTGARLARNEIRATLAGRHVEYRVNGGYLGRGDQHLDTTTFIDHAEPDCASHELYKGVLAGRARGVFQGKILVRPHAQKTDGYQMNRALLLSREAEINSKPELEIYADDVKCSHGATVGELEDDQLFYLMARGIPRERARAMLVAAYVDEAIDQIGREPVREAFRAVAADWMHTHIAGAEA